MAIKTTTPGVWLPKSTSDATELSGSLLSSRKARIALLILLGLLGVAAHAWVRWPLKLPGHHGLEWMALLMFARTTAPERWAASITALSAAAGASLPWFGLHDGLIGPGYLLSGVIVDTIHTYVVSARRYPALLAAGAGLAHMGKPATMWIASLIWGTQFGALSFGMIPLLISHFGFGAAGGLIGILAGTAMLRLKSHR